MEVTRFDNKPIWATEPPIACVGLPFRLTFADNTQVFETDNRTLAVAPGEGAVTVSLSGEVGSERSLDDLKPQVVDIADPAGEVHTVVFGEVPIYFIPRITAKK